MTLTQYRVELLEHAKDGDHVRHLIITRDGEAAAAMERAWGRLVSTQTGRTEVRSASFVHEVPDWGRV